MVWQNVSSLEQQQFDRRGMFLFTVIAVFFSLLILRLFYLQVVRGKYYLHVSESNRTQIFFQPAARGTIYDLHGQVLVDHKPKFMVLFSPLKLSDDVFANVIQTLERIIGVSKERLLALVGGDKKSSAVIQIAEDISRSAFFSILESRPNLPGITITIEPTRRYPFQAWGAHLFGHLGEISPNELSERLQDGYKSGDIIGKSGLEKVYDYYLRGKAGGMQLEVDASGRSQRVLYEIPSIPGNDLVLNIDLNVQQAAEKMFVTNQFAGAAIAIDPWSGKVRALVSSPNYDPNIFLKSLNDEQNALLFRSSIRPMFNRALQGQYALGSVFKIMTMIAALETAAPVATQKLVCKGSFQLGRRTFRCWEKEGHGRVGLIEALTRSCDVYFYQLGLSAGLDAIVKYGKMFGFGSIAGIDLSGEKEGLMPNEVWKKKKTGQIWYHGDTVNLSIGQGYLLVTPIQVAVMMAAVASRGKLFVPFLLDRVVTPTGEVLLQGEQKLLRQINVTAETWDLLDTGLTKVIEEGTGRACRIEGLRIGGKTGTVENPHGDDHAWFAAYAGLPGQKPRIAVAVLVEHGKHGASAAAPIAREMIRAAFPELNVAKPGS